MSVGDHVLLTPLVNRLSRRAALAENESEALLALPRRMETVDPGTYLVREGDAAESCCLLLSGFAFRHKMSGAGSRQILSVQLKGDIIGLGNGLLDVADHSTQTLSRASIAFIPRRAILDLAIQYSNLAQAFWRETLVDASVAREWIVNVGQRDARQRIAHIFCEVAVRQGLTNSTSDMILDWPLTQEQLGDATGLTSVHVNRTIQAMRSAGLIRTDKRAIAILDWEALQSVGDFSRAYLHLPTGEPSRMH